MKLTKKIWIPTFFFLAWKLPPFPPAT